MNRILLALELLKLGTISHVIFILIVGMGKSVFIDFFDRQKIDKIPKKTCQRNSVVLTASWDHTAPGNARRPRYYHSRRRMRRCA